MSNSRKPKNRRTTPRPPRRESPARAGAAAHEPYLRQALAADAAEARGDAVGALELLNAMPYGPDGKPYWRPWRVERLAQLTVFEPFLPRWARSRWLLEQAAQDLDASRTAQVDEAMRIAIEIRGGESRLPGIDRTDARCKVMDGDWVFRQCLLYESGGLAHFLRESAAADLVVGADRIHDWARAPMGGYRYVSRAPATVTWEDLGTGEQVETANIGSAATLVPGECAIGRLVPIDGGRMFETVPLRVPEHVARRVAEQPRAWVLALRAARGQVDAGSHRFGLLSDVPTVIYRFVLLDEGVPGEDGADEAQASRLVAAAADTESAVPAMGKGLLAMAREAVRQPHDDPEELDEWACLAAGVLDPFVFLELPMILTAADAALLQEVGARVAEPAASAFRMLASAATRAA